MTFMRRPWPRSATIEPILPQPMTPSVLPVISTPMKRFFSHLPAWVEASACGIRRASPSISVIGGGDRVAERRVHHDHALGSGGRNVDVVDSDAGAPDHPQLLRLLQKLAGHLGGGADSEPVKVADHLGKLVLVGAELGLEHGLDAVILENLHRGIGKRVGNENLGGHGSTWMWVYPVVVRCLGCKRRRAGRLRRQANRGDQAAFGSDSLVLAKAQSSHCVRASTSRASAVAPHQMRNPGGASR